MKIDQIILMFIELRLIFEITSYTGDSNLDKRGITFKGFHPEKEKECLESLEQIDFKEEDLFFERKYSNCLMLTRYLDILDRYNKGKDGKYFNTEESTNQERIEFLSFVVGDYWKCYFQ